jgi:methyl-accepting chemotaxis protein/ABC-type sugar transport system substrate-binding protein
MSEQQTNRSAHRNNTRFIILSTAIFLLVLLLGLFSLYFINKEICNLVLPYGLTLIAVLLGVQLVLFFRFLQSIRLIDYNANLLSQGKLNISDIMTDKTRGLETLTLAFNDMKRNLLNFIDSTKSNVIILSDAVDKVTKSLDMSYKGNENIASNMATVAEKAQYQLKIVTDTLERIQDVSLRTNNITNTLANLEDFVANTVKMSNEGSKHLDRYNEQMDVITTNLKDTSNFTENLNSHLQEIDQVGGLILNITEQLKLLSLNSAVEAARAGESGKGFVVVAHEMNKLSSATRESIGQINKLLNNIMSSNAKVSESIDKVSESFHISKEIFNTVKDSFYTINNNANILNNDMKKVYEESQRISENTKGINEQGTILHTASHEISSITQDVAAITEQELAENEEINAQALSLRNMLIGIESLLKRYKTSVVPASQNSLKHLKIVMMSPLDHPFWHSVRQGALYAQNELRSKNVEVEYIGFEQMDHRFNLILNERIEAGCDGLVLPGFVGEIETYVEKANRRNIPVMAFNCDFAPGTKRLSYFGPDVYATGIMAGELLAKGMNEEGEVAIFRGDLTTSINKIRRDTVVSVLNKHKKIKIVAEIDENISNEIVNNRMKEVLTQFPNLKGVIVNAGGIIGAAHAIEEMKRVGKVKLFCFDYDNEIIALIKKGIIDTAMGQDPFGQGHDPIIYLYNYLVANEKPKDVTHTRIEVMDIRNVGDLD